MSKRLRPASPATASPPPGVAAADRAVPRSPIAVTLRAQRRDVDRRRPRSRPRRGPASPWVRRAGPSGSRARARRCAAAPGGTSCAPSAPTVVTSTARGSTSLTNTAVRPTTHGRRAAVRSTRRADGGAIRAGPRVDDHQVAGLRQRGDDARERRAPRPRSRSATRCTTSIRAGSTIHSPTRPPVPARRRLRRRPSGQPRAGRGRGRARRAARGSSSAGPTGARVSRSKRASVSSTTPSGRCAAAAPGSRRGTAASTRARGGHTPIGTRPRSRAAGRAAWSAAAAAWDARVG